jgi:hypothetical protein
MMDILSENSTKRIPKVSYRALKEKDLCKASVSSCTKLLNLFYKKVMLMEGSINRKVMLIVSFNLIQNTATYNLL